ncbi:MAG: anti-sigma factor antagonist, partial [Oscillospiraceae bacterium]
MSKLKTVISCENDILTIILKGEIDHHTIADVKNEVDAFIFANTPKTIVLSFENVSFMDSSGIGFIIGRVRTAKTYGGEV